MSSRETETVRNCRFGYGRQRKGQKTDTAGDRETHKETERERKRQRENKKETETISYTERHRKREIDRKDKLHEEHLLPSLCVCLSAKGLSFTAQSLSVVSLFGLSPGC